jgi:Prokaryotic E2 family E
LILMMPPQLAAEIEVFRSTDQVIEVIEEGARFLVVFREFGLPDGRYSPRVTDLMLMADYQYPMSRLDMYWTDPAVRLVNRAYPQGAELFEDHGGRRWQRWSWHYPAWDPSRHNLRSHLEVFYDRLARGA